MLAVAVLVAACDRTALPVEPFGGDFTLTDHNGHRFDLTSLRGQAVLVFFGYSSCPEACPTTLSKLSRALARLGEDRGRVKTLYVSVDPDRDTPEVLKADLAHFDLDALGLTGSKDAIDRVVRQYRAAYSVLPLPESAALYSITHTTTVYVLDGKGQIRLQLPYEATVDDVEKGIRQVLRLRE